MNRQIVLQTSLFSHTDGITYTVDQAVRLAMDCQAMGVSIVHLHAYKLGGLAPFMEMARILEREGGPLINVGVSDYRLLVDAAEDMPRSLAVAAMHGGDCNVFGTFIPCSYESCEKEMADYLAEYLVK